MQRCHVGAIVCSNGLVICAHLLMQAMLMARQGEPEVVCEKVRTRWQ
jgi:hypothetical protein